MNIDYPFHYDDRGRTALTSDDDHLRDMLEQLLFTNPGERVNRPQFGCGLRNKLFEPNSPELAATVQLTVHAGVTANLGTVIDVTGVTAVADDASLEITIAFRKHSDGTNGQAVIGGPSTP